MKVVLPNGKIAEIDDAATPEVIAKIKAANPAPTRKERVASGAPRKAQPETEVQKRVREGNSSANMFTDGLRSLTQGFTFNFADEIAGAGSAATRGVYNAIRKGNVGEIGREYTTERDAQRQLDTDAKERSPLTSIVSEIGGAVVNPIGAGAKGVQLLSRAARGAGMTRAATKAANVAARIEKSGNVAKGALAGANQGTLNAVGVAEDDVTGSALAGGVTGGVVGGVVGGAISRGSKLIQAYKSAKDGNAQNVAYQRIEKLLNDGGTTPEQAALDIARRTDARGGDAMVQDLTPGLRAQAASISRKPNVPSSNALIETGQARIDARPDRFGKQVRENAKILDAGDDAYSVGDILQGTRRAAGRTDYAKGGEMDGPLKWSNELDDFFKTAPENTNATVRKARDDMMERRENPDSYNMFNDDGTVTAVPSLRTLDYMKRRFDIDIGVALKVGDKARAQALSEELTSIKGLLGVANPKYKEILATQRDLFQKQKALEDGMGVLKRVGSEPRVVLREIAMLPKHAQEEWRIGIIDAMINSNNKANPLNYFKSITRTPAQREVMEFAFGGKVNFANFQKWVNREVRSQRADLLTAPGRQSETSRVALAEGGSEDDNLLSNALRGYAFGGAIGAVSGGIRTIQNMATGTTPVVQEEIAKILLSKGDTLVKGIKQARDYSDGITKRIDKRALGAAKGSQQLFTDLAGGQ
jgi:hypothetical protein